MSFCKPCTTPISSKVFFTAEDPLFSDPILYRSLVRSSIIPYYNMAYIGFAANSVCQCMPNPKVSNFQAVKRILRYLQGTIHYKLHYRANSLSLQAFSDSDWARDVLDRKSTSGYCMHFGTNPIKWSGMKQPTVSCTSTEAEYRSLASMVADSTTTTIWCMLICLQ